MIKVKYDEYKEGDCAVKTVSVTFLGIVIYKSRKSTTNSRAVTLLSPVLSKKVKGFV